MAYSSVRVQFEIGHEASVRTKKTPEGFTHDWEVFVRGADNTDIQCFVDKVVFHLHETFPKPKRVIKEPPYIVKESGYAGFVLPIDVYLKNKEEPKKISFQYDLGLQPSGPPISRVLREPRLFQNPSEDFRRKLIRGGGVGVDTPTSDSHAEDLKTSSANAMSQTKSKLTESPVKKHKPEVPSNHSFAELFGTPIRRVLEPKKLPEVPKKKETPESEKKKSNKHGIYKDEKDVLKEKEKEKYVEKERNKERDKSKDKVSKRSSSPPAPLPQVKSKEDYKKHEEKEKKKEDHEDKKKKKEEKEKKEKSKDPDKQEHKKDKKDLKEGEYLKKLISTKPPEVKPVFEKPVSESTGKEKPEKEKHKHRHKKKEKEKNRDKEKHRKEKDKDSKERSKEKEVTSKKRHEETREKEEKVKRKSISPPPVQEKVKKGPLNALLDELGSSDSASPLSEEETIPSFKPFPKPPAKLVPEPKPQPQPVNVTTKLKSTNLNSPADSKSQDVSLGKAKKEKSFSKKNKKSEKDPEKKKVKEERRPISPSSERDEEEELDEDVEKEKVYKEDRIEEEKPKTKDKENRKRKREKSEEKQFKKKSVAESVPPEVLDVAEETRRPDKFTKEYIAQLKDLQHRIMSLEDNAELRKVVKVIEETGQYEITKKTFDFDLCALDFETVKRLQDFFAPT